MRVVAALAGVYGARFWARTVERYYSRVLGKAFVDCAPGLWLTGVVQLKSTLFTRCMYILVQYSAAYAVAYSTHGEFVFVQICNLDSVGVRVVYTYGAVQP